MDEITGGAITSNCGPTASTGEYYGETTGSQHLLRQCNSIGLHTVLLDMPEGGPLAASVNCGTGGTAGVSGLVWNDPDSDGVVDGGEAGLSGIQVCLYGLQPPNEDGPLLDCTTSNGSGQYAFSGLPAGFYMLRQFLIGRSQTYPASGQPQYVELDSAVVPDKNFGSKALPPGAITGLVFDDVNVNGVQDGGEGGVASGVSVCAHPMNACTATISGGTYAFSGVPAGSQTVFLNFQPTKIVSPGDRTVMVLSNQTTANVNFALATLPPPPPQEVVVGGNGLSSAGLPSLFAGTPTAISKNVTDHCEPGNQPLDINLVVSFANGTASTSLMMIDLDGLGGAEVWQAIFAPFLPGAAHLTFYVDCPPNTPGYPEDPGLIAGEDEIQDGGNIYIDPSGVILDLCNGNQPLSGVTVTLLKESPPTTGNFVAPGSSHYMPTVNPQTTGADGRYGWVVVPGSYRVQVAKAGYTTVTSATVKIPPAVTDLNVGLGDCDLDGDGVIQSADNCPMWPNAAQTLPSWPVPAGDADCDGFRDAVGASNSAPETYIVTDPTKHCAANAGSNNEPSPDAWPADFNDDRVANGQDTGKYGGPFGSFNKTVAQGPFGPPGQQIPGERFDFSGNGIINGQDTGKYQAYFNKTCA